MTETKQGKATDRKATEAVNTIRIYCKNNDIHDCVFNCAIRQVCRGYFLQFERTDAVARSGGAR